MLIDLRQAPYGLDQPEDVLDEELPDGKLILVYKISYLRDQDFELMREHAAMFN